MISEEEYLRALKLCQDYIKQERKKFDKILSIVREPVFNNNIKFWISLEKKQRVKVEVIGKTKSVITQGEILKVMNVEKNYNPSEKTLVIKLRLKREHTSTVLRQVIKLNLKENSYNSDGWEFSLITPDLNFILWLELKKGRKLKVKTVGKTKSLIGKDDLLRIMKVEPVFDLESKILKLKYKAKLEDEDSYFENVTTLNFNDLSYNSNGWEYSVVRRYNTN